MAVRGCKISREDQNVIGEMTLWGKKERYGRERWKILAEGYFLQWKDTA